MLSKMSETRNTFRSSVSRTMIPRPCWEDNNPSFFRLARASRMTVLLTPNFFANSVSGGRRSPGLNTPDRISCFKFSPTCWERGLFFNVLVFIVDQCLPCEIEKIIRSPNVRRIRKGFLKDSLRFPCSPSTDKNPVTNFQHASNFSGSKTTIQKGLDIISMTILLYY